MQGLISARLVALSRAEKELLQGGAVLGKVFWPGALADASSGGAAFDDTLPISDGLMEIGNQVEIEKLTSAMEDWFHRKSYIPPGSHVVITKI